jgi:hypothetical protein
VSSAGNFELEVLLLLPVCSAALGLIGPIGKADRAQRSFFIRCRRSRKSPSHSEFRSRHKSTSSNRAEYSAIQATVRGKLALSRVTPRGAQTIHSLFVETALRAKFSIRVLAPLDSLGRRARRWNASAGRVRNLADFSLSGDCPPAQRLEDALMLDSASCRLCAKPTYEHDALCVGCKSQHGPRVAAVLARALAEPGYASACLAALAPEPRARLARALAERCLSSSFGNETRGPGVRAARAAPPFARSA